MFFKKRDFLKYFESFFNKLFSLLIGLGKNKKKGGDPTAPSRTVTLLRLNPHRHQYSLPIRSKFEYQRLCWLDGRCVQEARTYSPRHD